MTSFTEEFFGCRFRRDKISKAKRSETTCINSSCCARGKKLSSEETPNELEKTMSGIDDRPLVIVTPPTQHVPEKTFARLGQRLQGFEPGLRLSVVAALQPQIAELERWVESLRQSRQIANANVSNAVSYLDPTHIAKIVSSALSSRFEDLASQTAVASAAVEAAASFQREAAQTSQHVTAGLVKQLLPQITGPIEKAVEDALRPRLQELEQSVAHTRRRHKTASSFASRKHKSSSSANSSQKSTCDNGIDRPPEQMLKRTLAGTMSTLGVVRRQATLSQNRLPPRAFVVNFRRLVEVQKILAIIHEFIRDTAIATLTLVAAASYLQLIFSIFFVTLVLVLFVIHEGRHDRMDIGDYKNLLQLLEDDDSVCNNKRVQNPTRILKALSLDRTNRYRRIRSLIGSALCVLILLVVWASIIGSWAEPAPDDVWLGMFDFEERRVQATLLLVGTAMVAFHISFEWLYWRETQCVMPTCGVKAWDPRSSVDGVPNRYRWFGLPSMWFTSQQSYDDLRLWITLLRKDGDAVLSKIHPEEMALFSLQPEGASYLRKTLADAKLFSMTEWEFRTRDAKGQPIAVAKGEEPEKLGLSFVFYDKLSETFSQPGEDYQGGVMRLLTRTNSDFDPV